MLTKPMRRWLVTLLMAGVLTSSCGKASLSGDADAVRGAGLAAQGKYKAAAAAYESALRKGLSKEAYEDVQTCLGNAYNRLKEWDKAIAAHKQAIAREPRFHTAWVNLGIVYRLTGEFAEAERCYSKALEIKPDYPELRVSLGSLYIHQERYEDAVRQLEKATKLDSSLPNAWANLALVYAMVGKFDAADVALRRAVTLGYKNGLIVRERIDSLKTKSDKR